VLEIAEREALEINVGAAIISSVADSHGKVGDRKALPLRVGGARGALVDAPVSVGWARGKMVGGRWKPTGNFTDLCRYPGSGRGIFRHAPSAAPWCWTWQEGIESKAVCSECRAIHRWTAGSRA
jgi:hypothetical protein